MNAERLESTSSKLLSSTCGVCQSNGPHDRFVVREMMFGMAEEFEYFQCTDCGCLQIARVPDDIARFYKNGYYSLAKASPRSFVRKRLELLRDEYELWGRGVTGKVLAKWFPSLALRALRPLKLAHTARILDVGCGTGVALLSLARAGFSNVAGVEPFAADDIQYAEGPRVFSRSIDQMDGLWDVIAFNHSFEHVDRPADALTSAAALLGPNGTCVVRLPLVDCFAWRRYGVNWCQIDAPRHLFLHSRRSLEIVASKAGLRIDSVVYDSGAFQFWGSEQYRMNIPLRDPRSYYVNPPGTLFTRRKIADFAQMAERLNAEQDGDQAVFYLRKR